MIQDGMIMETQKIDPIDKRSWFISNSVQEGSCRSFPLFFFFFLITLYLASSITAVLFCIFQDGSLYFMTPIDPLFIAIPMLDLVRKKVR